MNKMPDWPSLWELEPALKPDGLEYVRTAEPAYATVRGWVDDAMAAALCRDAAVRWLESQFEGAGIIAWRIDRPTRRAAGTWFIGYHEGYSDFKDLGEGPTKDDALFDACKNVIATKGAA